MPRTARLAYNLARSLERAGDLQGAIDHYRLYLEVSPKADDRASVEATITALRQTAAEQQGTLTLTTTPPGAAVMVDDAPWGLTPATRPITPGRHRLVITLAGHAPLQRDIDVAPRASEKVSLALVANGAGEPAPGPPGVLGRAAPAWRTVTGWSTVGAGVAMIGVGAWFNAAAADTVTEAESLHLGQEEEHAALGDDLDHQKTLTAVGYGVGGALVAGGVVLLLWPEGDADEAATRLHVAPNGLVVRGGF